MKIIKPFKIVPEGEVYPIELQIGDDCPPEFEATAVALGAVAAEKTTRKAKTEENGNPDA